jgi:hypothetical protein
MGGTGGGLLGDVSLRVHTHTHTQQNIKGKIIFDYAVLYLKCD